MATLLERMTNEFPFLSRDEIYAHILCGEVKVNEHKEKNPKNPVASQDIIEIIKKKYVSRGGIKLEEALRVWDVVCRGKIFIDGGSSTGGFTDCLLQHGAAGVHAVDVGYNQIDYRLRKDSRVYVHEKTNIMDITSLNPQPHAAVADLSFRSIHGAATKLMQLVSEKYVIALIKPQFEIDTSRYTDFNGVISNNRVLLDTMNIVVDRLYAMDIPVAGVILSPIKGKKGNVEFLFLFDYKRIKSRVFIKNEVGKLIASLKRIS